MQLNATLIFEIISFLILLAILTRYVYKPFLKLIDERSLQIRNNLAEAEQKRMESEKNYLKMQQDINEAKREVLFLKEETKRHSEELKEKILKEAEEKAGAILVQNRQDIVREIEHSKAELKLLIAQTSVAIASKILEREIKEDDHEALIQEGIKNLRKT